MSACSSTFITKYCQCLADPMNPWATICGYIDVNNGLVYPCELGCCIPACTGLGHQPPGAVQFRKSDGNKLPLGYDVNLPHSDTPNLPRGASEFGGTGGTGGTEGASLKVWQVFLSLLIILGTVLVSSFLA
jgi:hypothetical protein